MNLVLHQACPCAFGSFHQRPRAVLAFVALSGIARMLSRAWSINPTNGHGEEIGNNHEFQYLSQLNFTL